MGGGGDPPNCFMRFLCAHITLKCYDDENFGDVLIGVATREILKHLGDFEVAAYSPLVDGI